MWTRDMIARSKLSASVTWGHPDSGVRGVWVLLLGTGPTHCGPPHCTSRTHEQCHTHVYTHVRAFKHILLSMHSKHHTRPYTTGVHIPKAHNGSCPCTSIRMWPSDDTSSQLKLSRPSEKAFAVTRSAAAAHESDSLGARRASRRALLHLEDHQTVGLDFRGQLAHEAAPLEPSARAARTPRKRVWCVS